jgi:hypothetical protein
LSPLVPLGFLNSVRLALEDVATRIDSKSATHSEALGMAVCERAAMRRSC